MVAPSSRGDCVLTGHLAIEGPGEVTGAGQENATRGCAMSTLAIYESCPWQTSMRSSP